MSQPKDTKVKRARAVRESSERTAQSRPMMWRIGEIHRIIAAGKYPNCSTLAKRIEVSDKTIRRDIEWMRDQRGWPIEYDAVRHGYHYTGPVDEFPALQLTRGELVSLFIARKALEPLRGTRLEKILAESVEKIAEACPEHVSFHWDDLDEAFSVKASGALPADVELFNNLLDAAMKGREVTFAYQGLKNETTKQRRVQPYHVGQFEHGWYVVGFDVERQGIRNFALQRLSALKPTAKRFTRPADFDAQQYLSGGFGVWGYDGQESQGHEVQIEFTDWAARFVAERRWHATQEIEELEGAVPRIRFRATVCGLEEITRWVLSWGSKARVLAPQEFADRVEAELGGALGFYRTAG